MNENTVTLDDIFALFRESEQQRKEYQRKAELEMAELRKIIEQTNKQIAQIEQTNKQIDQNNKRFGELTSPWAEFVENKIKPAAARIFKEHGIDVKYTALCVQRNNDRDSIEIDIWVESLTEIVAIEVKSDLEIQNVKHFLEVLGKFKEVFTRFQNYKVYGAVAGIRIDEQVNEYATQEGLYLIQPAGDSVIIANSQNLKRRVW